MCHHFTSLLMLRLSIFFILSVLLVEPLGAQKAPVQYSAEFAIFNVNKSLIFSLEGVLFDIDTKDQIQGALVEVSGPDGSVYQTHSDQTGFYEFESIQADHQLIYPNTSYSIAVSTPHNATLPSGEEHRYLSCRGEGIPNEVMESTAFVRDFALVCADCGCGEIALPHILYSAGRWHPLVDDGFNALDSLEYLYDILLENQTIIIEIASHTDMRGSEQGNLVLSQKRAEACVDYLVDKGIASERLVPAGYGESWPIVSAEEIAALPTVQERQLGHAKNRRTVFRVLSWDYLPEEEAVVAKNLFGEFVDSMAIEPVRAIVELDVTEAPAVKREVESISEEVSTQSVGGSSGFHSEFYSGINILLPEVYPNPSHGKFNVNVQHHNSDVVEWILMNAGGQSVASGDMKPNPAGATEIDVSGISPGAYLLMMQSNSGEVIPSIKVVIQ